MPAPLLVADVPWLLYRSFFALPKSIADDRGEPVNALLGTVNAIVSLLETPPPSGRPRAVVACTGAEQATYRVELYPPYHAHRDPMPPELAAQWRGKAWPSAKLHAHVLSPLPTGTFPGVDDAEVHRFLEAHAGR